MPAPVTKRRTQQPGPDDLTLPLAGLLADPAGSSRDFAVRQGWIDPGDDIVQVEPIVGALRILRSNRGLLLDGAFTTRIAGVCSRCLTEITVPLDLAIEEEVLPSIDLASGQPLDPDLEPEVVRLTDHHELELEPLLRESVQLAEPIAPLCRPDCPGLCLECGELLADRPHDHGDQPIDPRLAALAGFRVDDPAPTD